MSKRRRVSVPAHVDAQMVDALVYTATTFGHRKYEEYRGLIAAALEVLEQDAEAGDRRPDIDPEAWLYPISRGGGRARHVFLYRITEDEVLVEAFRYDGMDLPAHWPRK